MEVRACLAQKSPWNSSAIVLVGFANRSVYSSSCSSNGITCVNGAYCINQSWHFGRVLLFVSVCWTSELWNKNLRIDDSINLCHSFFFFENQLMPFLKLNFIIFCGVHSSFQKKSTRKEKLVFWLNEVWLVIFHCPCFHVDNLTPV